MSSRYLTEPLPDVPSEQRSQLAFGLLVHLGPAVLFSCALALFGMTIPVALVAFVFISLANLAVVLSSERVAPSVDLPRANATEVREGLGLVFVTGVVGGSVVVVGGWLAASFLFPGHMGSSPWFLVPVAVLLTDGAYYWIHRSLNHGRGRNVVIRWFRRKHARHHQVTVLDFFRGNISSFVDTAVTGFQIPLVVLATVFGMDLTSTVVAYALVLMLQATHHVNHTFNLGPFRYVFMDNHAHKLHHCPRGRLVNHAALFSIWDRLFGTYYEDWRLSSNYMSKHHIALPLRPLVRGRASGSPTD